MLPVVQNEKKSVRIIAVTTILMILFSIFPFFLNEFGIVYVLTATVFGAAMLALSLWLLVRPSEKAAWTVFKFSSPYLTAIFIAFIVDALLH
jgi:protoheme IX farnesyltransferase